MLWNSSLYILHSYQNLYHYYTNLYELILDIKVKMLFPTSQFEIKCDEDAEVDDDDNEDYDDNGDDDYKIDKEIK